MTPTLNDDSSNAYAQLINLVIDHGPDAIAAAILVGIDDEWTAS